MSKITNKTEKTLDLSSSSKMDGRGGGGGGRGCMTVSTDYTTTHNSIINNNKEVQLSLTRQDSL